MKHNVNYCPLFVGTRPKWRLNFDRNDQQCKNTKELDDICGFHTFQSVKTIIMYVDQLQQEKLSNKTM